ncbi:uncharacterized protein LOC111903608 [Lactuca sativa]|uniref:uncharacterized protein LOC111903608 n=1 Tax=Lactuca sativa TaxID=4236 RepID=UPI0022AF1C9C|nr:uncharacterized protein LOC111903608 [Lactuca sativa]
MDKLRVVTDDSKKRKFVSSSNVCGPIDCVYKSDRGKAHQSTLDKNNPIKEKLKSIAWKKFAIWAYTVGLPFSAVRDESFQDVIDSIGDYGKGMPAPSYHNVRVTLLKEVLQDTNKFVDSFRPQWQKYGCSIMSYFWTNGKGRALIKFLVNCPTGTVFLKSIDASEHVKDAQLIVKMINQVIEDVDNGSNYKAAGNFLEEQHPKLFWTPCAAHCVNLMIQDLREKIKKIKGVLTDARLIVVYIYNHGRILNTMRKLTKNKELHSAFVKKAMGKKVERIVAKQAFWDDVYFSCQIFSPLVDMIRLVDREDQPCMGYTYDAMSRAKEQISKNLKGGPNARMESTVLSKIQQRWPDQLHHPLHAAGCFLNPAIYHGENSEIEKIKDIVTGLYVAINRLVPDEDENDLLRQQLDIYIDSEDIWWHSYGIDTPLLQNFAIKVLSQTCSASPCERNWSTFDNLHSKKRNCLLQQKLNDLVFIQYNTRLQRRFELLKSNKTDPILLRDVEENDEWMIPTEAELQDFVDARDGLLWSDVREAMGGNVDIGPSTRSKRERYRDDDDDNDQTRVELEYDVYVDLDVEVNALDDVDSEAEPVDCD